jgi:hypothetical protein
VITARAAAIAIETRDRIPAEIGCANRRELSSPPAAAANTNERVRTAPAVRDVYAEIPPSANLSIDDSMMHGGARLAGRARAPYQQVWTFHREAGPRTGSVRRRPGSAPIDCGMWQQAHRPQTP